MTVKTIALKKDHTPEYILEINKLTFVWQLDIDSFNHPTVLESSVLITHFIFLTLHFVFDPTVEHLSYP